VFYNQNSVAADDLLDKINRSALPKLWIPKRDNLYPVESIPLLGSGKVDLKKVKALALEKQNPEAVHNKSTAKDDRRR